MQAIEYILFGIDSNYCLESTMSQSALPSASFVGRYAPSPTGDLHLGNLRTALLAWLHARLNHGKFVLRIEDLDTPRVVTGSVDSILSDLEWLGLDWDGELVYQSKRQGLYKRALNLLSELDLIYSCFCSRKDIQQAASAPHAPLGVYPGTCSKLSKQEVLERSQMKHPALRLKVESNLRSSCGDFVVKRADKLFAYQLAVVVDDLAQGVTHVVRGQDLVDSTSRQRYLARLLEPSIAPIEYFHVPLLCDSQGKRFAKRDGSQSARQWRDENKSAEELIGLFCQQLGLLPNADPISVNELITAVDLSIISMSLQKFNNTDA